MHQTLLLTILVFRFHTWLHVWLLLNQCAAAVFHTFICRLLEQSLSVDSATWVCFIVSVADIAYDFAAWSHGFKQRKAHAPQHSAEQGGHAAMKVP